MNDKLNIVDKALQIVEKYKLTTIFKSLLVIIIVSFVFWFISNPTYIFDKWNEYQQQQHQEQLEQRINNNEKLHIIIERLMFKIDADRILLLECHNGGSNINGLPFAKISAIYESLNDSILPISQDFQQQQLSLYPFSNYLFNNKYFYGDTEELLNIDKGLYYKFKSHNINHFACYVLYGVDKPIAFLLVGYEKLTEKHNCKYIKELIIEEGLQMRLLLELNKK
jgi:hypothetical protein